MTQIIAQSICVICIKVFEIERQSFTAVSVGQILSVVIGIRLSFLLQLIIPSISIGGSHPQQL